MGTPNYPKDMATEWQKMKRDVKGAFTSGNSRKGFQSLGKGLVDIFIGLVLHPGSYLSSLYSNGQESLFIGQHNVAGQDVEGLIIRRPNGSLTFWAYGSTVTGDAFWSFWDKSGNIVFSDDAASGTGLARPWIPYNTFRTSLLQTPQDVTSSTSYVTHQTVVGYMQHPRIQINAYLASATSPFTDTSQIRLVNPTGGAILATSSAVANDYVWITANHPDFEFGKWFKYDIQIRRVSGSGSVGFTVLTTNGVQT